MRVEDLIHRWRGPLIGLIASWGASWSDAAELAADTFAEAWIARERFVGDLEDAGQAGAWLRGIAFRLHAHKKRRAARDSAQDVHEEHVTQPESTADERIGALRAAIDCLPDPQRAAVLVHYLDETSVREAAALLEVTEKVIEGRLYRARKRLRELVEREVTITEGEERS